MSGLHLFECVSALLLHVAYSHGEVLATATSGSVRLLSLSGARAHVGLVQVTNSAVGDSHFGSVCGMSPGAADVACRQLGYDFGTVSSSGCRYYGGVDSCGDAATPITMKNLRCSGGEMSVQECEWDVPDASCDHASDVVLHCGVAGMTGGPMEGSARLLSADGAPSIDGTGRLEVYRAGAWSSVCNAGFSAGAATLACKAMGFAGAQPPSGTPMCGAYHGADVCGTKPPQISELACDGHESGLLACPHQAGDDVFCAPEENVAIACEGGVDAR